MSHQMFTTDLLAELSTEEQQSLSGGQETQVLFGQGHYRCKAGFDASSSWDWHLAGRQNKPGRTWEYFSCKKWSY
ncbi:hypothetical protein FNW02_09905 [Komarekiella sp. 'clone 1']|uniref:Uncharacterized protein n=1 Tax=Komarekiella delphini-convector SJRDD-AB1 TaxID=2593771 RepID=A0AA40VQC5_9NOST|nr:hypothetical protein [Komarekiella delphini-convector]MBD6616137.1 hypothetical protein [Komarekiella delphini-convector SJRDD-AB1]